MAEVVLWFVFEFFPVLTKVICILCWIIAMSIILCYVFGLAAFKNSEMGRVKTTKVIRIGWIPCPACGGETRCKMRQDTVMINFPLYCPQCGKETLVSVSNLTVTVVGNGDDSKTEGSGIASGNGR